MRVTLEQVYRQHFQLVWRVLARLGVPERDLADAVQDVFVVVHRRLPEFEGRSSVSTWLYGICVRVASARRRRASSRHERLESPDVDPEDPTPGPEDRAEAQDLRLLAEQILAQLPFAQRAVFVLFELEGLSSASIAERLEIPLGTVHSRLRLARAAFRREADRVLARDRFALRAGGDS